MTKAFDSALRLLTMRDHGAKELCNKLERKGFSEVDAHEAVEECQRLGLQSDSRFAECYSRYRIRQGYGPLKIAQELKNKAIESALIQSALNAEADNWLDYALTVWHKKARGQTELSFIEKQKQQKFLLYRGFSMDIIAQVVKELT